MSTAAPTVTTDRTPTIKTGRNGRPPIDWEALYGPAEELAAKGMQSNDQICRCLKVHPNTLSRADDGIKLAFEDAVKNGHAAFTSMLLDRFKIRLPHNDSLLMFSLKQQFGAGWSDQAVNVQHGGKIEIVITERVLGAEEHAPIDITPKAIEGDS